MSIVPDSTVLDIRDEAGVAVIPNYKHSARRLLVINLAVNCHFIPGPYQQWCNGKFRTGGTLTSPLSLPSLPFFSISSLPFYLLLSSTLSPLSRLLPFLLVLPHLTSLRNSPLKSS